MADINDTNEIRNPPADPTAGENMPPEYIASETFNLDNLVAEYKAEKVEAPAPVAAPIPAPVINEEVFKSLTTDFAKKLDKTKKKAKSKKLKVAKKLTSPKKLSSTKNLSSPSRVVARDKLRRGSPSKKVVKKPYVQEAPSIKSSACKRLVPLSLSNLFLLTVIIAFLVSAQISIKLADERRGEKIVVSPLSHSPSEYAEDVAATAEEPQQEPQQELQQQPQEAQAVVATDEAGAVSEQVTEDGKVEEAKQIAGEEIPKIVKKKAVAKKRAVAPQPVREDYKVPLNSGGTMDLDSEAARAKYRSMNVELTKKGKATVIPSPEPPPVINLPQQEADRRIYDLKDPVNGEFK